MTSCASECKEAGAAGQLRRSWANCCCGGWINRTVGLFSLLPCRLVERYGEGQWAVISQQLNKAFGKSEDQGRIGKQCREVRHARNARTPLLRMPLLPEGHFKSLCRIGVAAG